MLMRSTSVLPVWPSVSESRSEASPRRASRLSPDRPMVSAKRPDAWSRLPLSVELTRSSSSRSDSCAPEIEARTRSAWLTTASRSVPSPSTSVRMRISLSE